MSDLTIKENSEKHAVEATTTANDVHASSSSTPSPKHGPPEIIGIHDGVAGHTEGVTTVEEIEESKKGWFAYFKTRNFYIVLITG